MSISRHRYSVTLALLTLSISVHAASIFEFDKWMKRIEKHSLSVQKHIAKKDAQASAIDAKAIEDLYALMQEYFEKRSSEQQGDAVSAVDLSRKGREAAANVAVFVNTNRFEEATKTMKTLMVECRTCHHAYKPLD